jgi:hypothetical protein
MELLSRAGIGEKVFPMSGRFVVVPPVIVAAPDEIATPEGALPTTAHPCWPLRSPATNGASEKSSLMRMAA